MLIVILKSLIGLAVWMGIGLVALLFMTALGEQATQKLLYQPEIDAGEKIYEQLIGTEDDEEKQKLEKLLLVIIVALWPIYLALMVISTTIIAIKRMRGL